MIGLKNIKAAFVSGLIWKCDGQENNGENEDGMKENKEILSMIEFIKKETARQKESIRKFIKKLREALDELESEL